MYTQCVSTNVTGYVLGLLLLFVLHIDSAASVVFSCCRWEKRRAQCAFSHRIDDTLASGLYTGEVCNNITRPSPVFVCVDDLCVVYLLFAGDGVAPVVIFLADAKGRLGVMNKILLEVVRILGRVSPQFVANSVQHLHVELLHLQHDKTSN